MPAQAFETASSQSTFISPQIEAALSGFLTSLKLQHASDSTIRNYRSDIKQFYKFLSLYNLDELFSKENLSKFVSSQKDKGLKHTSITRKIASINQFAIWADNQGLLNQNINWLDRASVESLSNSKYSQNTTADTLPSPTPFEEPVNQTPVLQAPIHIPTIKPTKAPTKPDLRLPKLSLPQLSLPHISLPQFKFKKPKINLNIPKIEPKKPKEALTFSQRASHSANKFILPYLNLGLIILFFIGLGFLGYNQLISETPASLAFPSVPTRPNRILSFQGRLTDTNQNPITTPTDFQFTIWDQVSGGTAGSCDGVNDCWYDTGTCSITPDQDGIFNVSIGGDCGSEIGEDVFSENASLWMEVSVEAETLAPRQPIRTVPYAVNSETVQGYPISATGAATVNTILVMDSSGYVTLGETSPALRSIDGTFTISGETLSIESTADTSFTSTNDGFNFILGGGAGDDLIVDTSTLVVESDNNRVGIGTTAPSAFLDVLGITEQLRLSYDASNYLSFTIEPDGGAILAGTGTDADIAINPGGDFILSDLNCTGNANGGALTADANGIVTCTDDDSGAGGSSNWTLNTTDGTLYPNNNTVDVLIGGTATTSAKFAVTNVNSGNPTTRLAFDATNYQTWAIASDGGLTWSALGTDADINIDFSGATDGDFSVNTDDLFVDTSTGNVGIGTTLPGALFTVGANLFQVNTSGIIAAIDGVPHAIEDIAGDLTITSNSTNIGLADSVTVSGNLAVNGGNITSTGALAITPTTTLTLNSTGNLTLDSSTDILLDADGADIIFQDATITFATFTNSSTDLTLDIVGGQLNLANADTINIGGATGRAYNSISDTTAASFASTDNDLYVEDILEVGGTAYVGGNQIFSDALWDNTLNVYHPIDEFASVVDLTLGGTATASANVQFSSQGWGSLDGARTGRALLTLVEQGDQDIIAASMGANTVFRVNNDGHVISPRFIDLANSSYFLDPAATGTSLAVAGSVGIGTTAPNDVLEVRSTTDAQLRLAYDDTNYQAFTVANDGGLSLAAFGTDADINISFAGATDGDFSVNTDDIFVDTSTGLVGIGTTVPSQVLDVNGDLRVRGNDITDSLDATRISLGDVTTFTNTTTTLSGTTTLTASSLATITSAASVNWGGLTSLTFTADNATINGSDAANGNLTLRGTTSGTKTTSYVLLQDTGGLVGIGTTAPSTALHITHDTQQLLIEPSSTINVDAIAEIRGHRNGATTQEESQLIFSNYDNDLVDTNILGRITGHVTNATTNIGDLLFYTYSDGATAAETMRLLSTGRVGIGTSLPGAKLEVEASSANAITGLLVDQNATNQIGLQIDQIADSTANALDIITSQISGNIIDLSYGAAESTTADVIGLSLNLNTNLTPASDFSVTGIELQTPAKTGTLTGSITDLFGINLVTAGALNTTNDGVANTVNWYGTRIQKPTLNTAASGDTVTSYGLYVVGAAVTDGGGTENNYGVIVDSSAGNSGFGTGAPSFPVEIFSVAPQLGLTADDVAGDMRITFSQTTTQRAFLEYLDSNDGIRIRNLYGEFNVNTGTGGSSALTFSVETDGDIDAEGTIELDIPAPAAGFDFAICVNTNGGSADERFQDCNGSATDIAEYYITESTDVGDVVVYSDVFDSHGNMVARKSGEPYKSLPLGVVSTYPIGPNGDVLGSDSTGKLPGAQPIGLVGRVPVKVSLENGSIRPGDPLTISSTPGVAMKASKSGNIIGYALENYDGSTQKSAGTILQEKERREARPEWPNPKPLPSGVGKILVFSDPGYHAMVALDENGNVKIENKNGQYVATSTDDGSLVSKTTSAAKAIIANIEAGLISAKEIVVSIEIKTPKLIANQINTDLISPLAGEDVKIKLGDKDGTSEVSITNKDNQEVAKIDDLGNATFKGNLTNQGNLTSLGNINTSGNISALGQINAKSASISGTATISGNLRVGQDATISGTLQAGQIDATSARISALEAGVAQLSEIRANTADIVNATISGTLYANDINDFENKVAQAIEQPSLLEKLMGLSSTNPSTDSTTDIDAFFANHATYSNSLEVTGVIRQSLTDLNLTSEDLVINAEAVFINRYLDVNGTAYIAQNLGIGQTLIVADSLFVGVGQEVTEVDGTSTTKTFGEISYSPLGEDAPLFKIQPAGKGILSLMAGLLTLDENGQAIINGDLTIAGDLRVEKTLLTNALTAGDFTSPLQVQLASRSGVLGAENEVKESRFEIINENGTPVATISAQGKANFASGIGVGSQDLNPGENETEIQSNKTSGTATVKAGQNHLKIWSNKLSEGSLIYVTPLGSTGNQVLYVKEKASDSFTIGFDNTTDQDVRFNWWIVN